MGRGGGGEREKLVALEMYHFMHTPLEGLKCTFGPFLYIYIFFLHPVCRVLKWKEPQKLVETSENNNSFGGNRGIDFRKRRLHESIL